LKHFRYYVIYFNKIHSAIEFTILNVVYQNTEVGDCDYNHTIVDYNNYLFKVYSESNSYTTKHFFALINGLSVFKELIHNKLETNKINL